MNIKSELNKPIKWFGSVTVGMLIYAILMGSIISLLIVATSAATVIKILFLLITGVIAVIAAYDGNETDEVKAKKAKRYGLVIFMSLFVIEIGLFMNSGYKETIPIKAIVTDAVREINVKTDANNTVISSEKQQYKVVTYYNLNDNTTMGYRNVEQGEGAKMEFLTNVTAKEIYIEYIPFIKYSEEFKYIRK